MLTTEVVFDRKKKASREKMGTVELRVTVNRKSQYLSTGVRVLKHQWKNGQIVNCVDCEEKMRRVRAIQKRLEDEIALCIEEGRPIDLQARRDALVEGGIASDMWLWMKTAIENLMTTRATQSHYWNMMVKLEQFGRIRRWQDCTVENVLLFDGWLHKLTKPHSNELIGNSGVYNYHKCLKALLHQAYDVGRLEQNPYDRLKGKFKRGDKENVEYLTEGEIAEIINLDLEQRIYREARDLFVFQMFTGLPFSDLMAFSIDNYKQVEGKWISRQERIKTGVPYVNQLLPQAVAVLERYGYVLPRINNAEYNERLKVVGRLAGITTRLHTHLGRHTFATLMLSNGVRIEHVSKMLGHTNIKQTQRYAKVLAKDVRESFDMVEEKLRGKV